MKGQSSDAAPTAANALPATTKKSRRFGSNASVVTGASRIGNQSPGGLIDHAREGPAADCLFWSLGSFVSSLPNVLTAFGFAINEKPRQKVRGNLAHRSH